MAISTEKKELLNNMNRTTKKAGLGDILNQVAYAPVLVGTSTLAAAATQTITVSGVVASDVALANVITQASTIQVSAVTTATDGIIVKTDGVHDATISIAYVVIRALS